MKKIVRPYVYKEDYDKVIAYAKINFMRTNNLRRLSFAKALEKLLKQSERFR
ncbi:hypothetical protein LCGC14_2296850 [marine sediment metagenome]|uniref:Uncharacterized protein n=1 Tax=marine sediment metagenome TaxID=412755 RepID=A0A0F9F246_9ZZZZ